MMMLKVTKNQGFTLSLEDTLFDKSQEEARGGGGGVGVKLTPPLPSRFRVNVKSVFLLWVGSSLISWSMIGDLNETQDKKRK